MDISKNYKQTKKILDKNTSDWSVLGLKKNFVAVLIIFFTIAYF